MGGIKKMVNDWLRQGDVILEKVDSIKGKAINKSSTVLAWGEVTGHKHLLSGQIIESVHKDERFLDLKTDCELVHEEHETLTVPSGLYKVLLQREVDLLGEVRQVMD